MEVLVFIACSLDGFIARPDGSIDWLEAAAEKAANEEGKERTHPEHPQHPEDHGYNAFMARVDVLVMGRATFEKVLSFPEWPYAGKRVVVLSRSLQDKDLPESVQSKVKVHPGPVETLAAQLRAEGVQGVYVDGGQVIQAFLRLGLIDELIITRIPVLLGSGLPLFGGLKADLPLQHVKTVVFGHSGFVQSVYRPILRP